MATHTSATLVLQPGGNAHYYLHEHAFTTLALIHRLFSVFFSSPMVFGGLGKASQQARLASIRCEATIGKVESGVSAPGGEAPCTKISPPPLLPTARQCTSTLCWVCCKKLRQERVHLIRLPSCNICSLEPPAVVWTTVLADTGQAELCHRTWTLTLALQT